SIVAVTTQVNAACVPPMSAMMMGIDVPTTFIASIETNMLMKRPVSARFLARPVNAPGPVAPACDAVRSAGPTVVSGAVVGVASGAVSGVVWEVWVMRGAGSFGVEA